MRTSERLRVWSKRYGAKFQVRRGGVQVVNWMGLPVEVRSLLEEYADRVEDWLVHKRDSVLPGPVFERLANGEMKFSLLRGEAAPERLFEIEKLLTKACWEERIAERASWVPKNRFEEEVLGVNRHVAARRKRASEGRRSPRIKGVRNGK